MSADAHLWHRGFVLHTRPYSNTSLIADVFTRDQGRVSLLAKGARRASSPHYAVLQAFTPLQLRWGGRGELRTLHAAETLGKCVLPPGSVFFGFYLNELLLRLLPKHDAHPRLLDYYAQTLQTLAGADEVEPPLRYFEAQLLHEMGYGLELETDPLSGAPLEADARYEYRIEQGPIRVTAVHAQGLTVHGDTLLALKARQLDTQRQQREAKQLLRMLLGEYLGAKPLQSRRLFREGFA